MGGSYCIKRHISWSEIDRCILFFQEQILGKSKYDAVFGISRGGLPIAVMISHLLQVPLGVIDIKGFDPNDPTSPYRVCNGILSPFPLKGEKKVLLVDDVIDHGNTIRASASFLPFEKSAFCVVTKIPVNELEREFGFSTYAFLHVDKNFWVTFPWEVSS